MIGSLLGGALCDKYGRKFTLCIGSIITISGALSTAFSIHFSTLLVLRGVLGLGVGLVGVVCPLYVSESAGEYHEGKSGLLGTLFQLAITIGIDIAFAVGLVVNRMQLTDSLSWRIEIGIGVIFGFLLLLIGFVMSESRVWLREQNTEKLDRNKKSCVAVCSNPKNLFVGVMLAACLQLTGINVVMFFGPKLLSSIPGINGNDFLILLLNLGIGIWNSITTLIAVFLVERFGRKPLMITGTAILTAACFISAVASFLPQQTQIIVIAVGLGLFLLGFETGPGCLFWVLINEVFDPEVREQANGFMNLLQWGFNLAVLSTYPFLFTINFSFPFFLYGGIGVLVTIALQISLPDTKKTKEYDDY